MSEQTREDLLEEIKELRDEVADLEGRVSEVEDENRNLSAENEKYVGRPEMLDAIDGFLNVVDRPVGKFKFTVPQSGEADRAILGLFDAINRNP